MGELRTDSRLMRRGALPGPLQRQVRPAAPDFSYEDVARQTELGLKEALAEMVERYAREDRQSLLEPHD
jgi:hypothetical protein